jgi:thimet oligopeptidase
MTNSKSIVLLLLALVASPSFSAALPADTGINWNMSADQITSSCAANLRTARDRIKALEKTQPRATSFANGLGAVEDISADLSDSLIAQTQLAQIAVDKPVRDAASDCSDKLTAFNTEVSADPVIYRYAQFASEHAPDAAGKQLAKIYLEQGRRSGASMSPAKRAKVTQLLDQITKLQTQFQKQLGEDVSVLHITEEESKSLPAEFIKTLKPDGQGFIVPVNESTVLAFLRSESSSDTRHRYTVIFNNRGGEDNVKRLAEAVRLRDQVARLAGFSTWADYQLDNKVAKTPTRALDLLYQVDAASLPKARSEMEELAKLKVADGDSSAFSIWDVPYYQEKLKQQRFSVDDNALRQYFPVDKVIPALLGIYQKLLGVKFEQIDGAKAWAPGVLEFDIVDTASGKPVGWFYFDLYPREGKYDHFATFPLRSGRLLSDGSYQMPVGAVIGNWPVGAPGHPSLLNHDEVTVFFHEFGHLMHDTLTRAPTESLAGTNVRQDFVEAPSQMLENWMWDPAILKEVSSNVETGQPLPDDVIKHMIELQHFDEGFKWASQAFYAIYDMKLHSSGASVDPTKLWFELEPKYTPFASVPGTVPEASFGHLMSGYDAGYYGYLWSLVYAQDMFTKFRQGGLESPEVGMQYRKIILEKGATEEPDALLREFLGRPVDVAAFDEYIGMQPAHH